MIRCRTLVICRALVYRVYLYTGYYYTFPLFFFFWKNGPALVGSFLQISFEIKPVLDGYAVYNSNGLTDWKTSYLLTNLLIHNIKSVSITQFNNKSYAMISMNNYLRSTFFQFLIVNYKCLANPMQLTLWLSDIIYLFVDTIFNIIILIYFISESSILIQNTIVSVNV